MTTLYPRLLPGETEKLFGSLRGRSPAELRVTADISSSRSVYAATGGTRITRDELALLSTELEKLAFTSGYPEPPGSNARNEFDRAVARHLHQKSGMSPGEASQRQVWAFLALVLAPHICAWRFASRSGEYVADRFKGTDLTRHTLARLWTRAHVLHDPSAGDPYSLLSAIGEADLDQIMSRRQALGATPALVRAIVRAHTQEAAGYSEGPSAREVLRDSLKRLLRLTAFLDLDWIQEERLVDLVREQRAESRKFLPLT